MLRARVIVLLAIAGLSTAATALAGSAEPTPLRGASWVKAEFTAESWWGSVMGQPRTLAGVARIQVHAWDTDPVHPNDEFDRSNDVGWVRCDPVGSPQCFHFPNGGERTNIRWLVIGRRDSGVLFANMSTGAGSYLGLEDGGAPGNEPVGFLLTRDAFGDSSGLAPPGQSGPLLGGNITIHLH